jgi:mitochondrial enoyl-[acyl-carrier protein] reductase / trans-2-enoyl-CoA reductase
LKQIRFETFGAPQQVARCVEVADPGAPAAWDVVVDIEASAINPADIARLAGRYGELPALPATAGLDAVGRVAICGSAVRNLAPGDRVLLLANDNWCQRRRIGVSHVFKVDSQLDVLQLAALKVGACSALELVRRQVPLVRGDWLVQSAPLSSVGRAVIQIARHDGFRTLNVVRRPEAVAEVLAAGGDAAILDGANLLDEAKAATGGAAIALGLDGVGGEEAGRLAALLKPGGVLVNYGMLAGQPMQIDCYQTIFRNLTVKGFWLTDRLARMLQAQRHALIGEAVDLLAQGVLRNPVAATYGLDEIGAALRQALEAGRQGKVFLLPNGPLGAAPQIAA